MSWNPHDRYVSDRLKRFYSLDDLIKTAYDANDFPTAANLAKEYLKLATTYRCNWNYGNAVHDANRVLGLISLKSGDQDAAVAYLLKSGKSTGSPQLNSFGPDLDLANALLQEGYVEPVKTYLSDIRSFWKMENGQVAEWLGSIDKGERPALNRFATKPSTMQIMVFWSAIAWPSLVVAGCLYFLRRRIVRKWLFGIAGLLTGYLALVAAAVGMGYILPAILIRIASSYASLVMFALYLSVGAIFVVSLLAVLGASRLFIGRDGAS